jgi:hypothetical protein
VQAVAAIPPAINDFVNGVDRMCPRTSARRDYVISVVGSVLKVPRGVGFDGSSMAVVAAWNFPRSGPLILG